MTPSVGDLIVRMGEPPAPVSRVGGKGHNLSLLAHHGIRVPPFLVLTTAVFERLAGDLLPALDELAASATRGAPAAQVAEQLQAQILTASFDPATERAIAEAVGELTGGRDRLLAVRSSAIDEDSDEHSFAGQLDSYLFQRAGAGLLASVKRCLASAFNERALVYRLTHGLPVGAIRAAVVIQEMVEAEVAGVAFTANPIGGNPEQLVVNAIFGIGEGVVGGELDSDTWVLDADGVVVREELADKRAMIVFDHERGEGTKEVPVEPARRTARTLQPAQLAELATTCRRIERSVYGGQPQDIEWCFRDGALTVLQARPIAAFASLRKSEPCIVFDNSNVVESYAGVPTPLTFSFASASFRATFGGVLERLGVSPRSLGEHESLLVNMLATVHGRMHYNLLNWYRYLQLIPSRGDRARELDLTIGITAEDAVDLPARPPRPLLERLRVGLRFAWKQLTLEQLCRDWIARFHRANGKYLEESFEGYSSARLIEIYRYVFAHGSPDWDPEILNFIGSQRAFTELRTLLARLQLPDARTLENDLIGGDGSIASMRPTQLMMELAELIRGDQAWRERFLAASEAELQRQILEERDPTFEPLRRRIEAFLSQYGCRSMNELKLEEDTLREDPTFLFSTLRSYVARPPAAFARQLESQVAARARAEAVVYGRADLPTRLRLRWTLGRARRHVYLREELRLVRGAYWGIVRRLFRAIGRNLERDGVLADWRDVFLLKVDEVAELVEGRSPDMDHVRELIALRQRERAEHLARPSPSRIFSYGSACAGQHWARLDEPRAVRGAGAEADGEVLRGIACGPGIATGRARVVLSAAGTAGLDGEILVTERTDPGWIPLYPSISGLIIERGSVLSHSAVVAREMGIPTVVGVAGATRTIHTDDEVVVNGSQGTVQVVKRAAADAT